MGKKYGLRCTKCEYRISIKEGVGMMYSPNAVFYGRCDDPTQNWSVAFPDGYCEEDKPLLLSIVDNTDITDKAFRLLAEGAEPDDEYAHELYVCPQCDNLENEFYFKLESPTETYEPDYKCSKCETELKRAKLIEEAEYTCPSCGEDKLINTLDFMRWD